MLNINHRVLKEGTENTKKAGIKKVKNGTL
jgi:hypothetical protein